MKIYVDGDACPVIGVIEKIAKKKGVAVVIVCDEMHDIYSDYCQVVKVPCGYDAVDMKIAVDVHKNDIVIRHFIKWRLLIIKLETLRRKHIPILRICLILFDLMEV